jgi:hypothetical protein
MSLRDVHGGRALVLRLILAELVARKGAGPLAPRVVPRVQRQAGFPSGVEGRRSAREHDDKEPA